LFFFLKAKNSIIQLNWQGLFWVWHGFCEASAQPRKREPYKIFNELAEIRLRYAFCIKAASKSQNGHRLCKDYDSTAKTN
jgi:hypothetical protein